MSTKKLPDKYKNWEPKEYRGVTIYLKPKSRTKYKNRRSYIHKYGVCKASYDEACRHIELIEVEGHTQDTLICQKRYPLHVNGIEVFKYVPDYDYPHNGVWVTEDVKGSLTDVYKIKRKMFIAQYVHNNPHRVFIESRKKRSKEGFNFKEYNCYEDIK